MDAIDARIAALEETVSTHERRITKHGEELDTLAVSTARMSVVLTQLKNAIDLLTNAVETLKSIPSDRWKVIADSAISTIVGGLITALLLLAGLKL